MDVASILGNLIGRTYPVFFISICLENPTLRTFFKVALSCSHRQENLTCWYVCRVSASRMYVASNLGRTAVVRTRSSLSRFCLGAPTIRNYTIGLLSAPRQEKCHLLNICRFSACSMHVASNLGSMYHVFFINICLIPAATKSTEWSQIKAAHTPKCDKPTKAFVCFNYFVI